MFCYYSISFKTFYFLHLSWHFHPTLNCLSTSKTPRLQNWLAELTDCPHGEEIPQRNSGMLLGIHQQLVLHSTLWCHFLAWKWERTCTCVCVCVWLFQVCCERRDSVKKSLTLLILIDLFTGIWHIKFTNPDLFQAMFSYKLHMSHNVSQIAATE